MTQVFHASRFFGVMSIVAAIDAGAYGPRDRRRVLIVTNNADIPEIALGPGETPGFEAVRDRFDAVHSWNEIIAPLHPSEWKPRAIEVPMLGRLLESRLGLDEPSELAIESVIVPPARILPGLFKDCPVTVYSDGLMAHSPTRDRLPGEISGRITRLHHLDLLPGVEPLLLREYGVPTEALPAEAFTRVVAEVSAGAPGYEADAVILGQYLSSLGIITAAEEADLHASTLRALKARGCRRVVFKPHPAIGRRHAHRLRRVAVELGVELVVADEARPAEVLFATARPKLVVGCFSTALITARKYFGLPVATMGLDFVMERLTPYENSNRIPVTIVDATIPRLAEDGTLDEPPAVDLGALVDAVAYCMQSEAHPELRQAAVDYLTANGRERYFRKKRLEALELMDAVAPSKAPSKGLNRLFRKA